MITDTPETIAAVDASDGQWSFVLKQACAKIERERDAYKSDLWAARTEHRMAKTTLSALAAERNQLRGALAQVAEDCTAWLHNQCDETACEFIKAVRQYAHEQSQAPLAPSSQLHAP